MRSNLLWAFARVIAKLFLLCDAMSVIVRMPWSIWFQIISIARCILFDDQIWGCVSLEPHFFNRFQHDPTRMHQQGVRVRVRVRLHKCYAGWGPLVHLDLSDNPFTFEVLMAAVQATKGNQKLQSLRLWSRHLPVTSERAIAMLAIELLESNPRIRALDLGFASSPTGQGWWGFSQAGEIMVVFFQVAFRDSAFDFLERLFSHLLPKTMQNIMFI